MHGLDMTRMEVFVDAAFVFAVTMLVISLDQLRDMFIFLGVGLISLSQVLVWLLLPVFCCRPHPCR